ncbi:MAG: PSD1 and planctomycete cytochrome C domain-containing protein [Pirellulaceae bacterium]
MHRKSAITLIQSVGLSLCFAAALNAAEPEPDQAKRDFFEKHVRPVLVTHCLECHGEKKQESNLRLDSRAGVLKGGDIGPAAVPGKPDESQLVSAVKRNGDLQMPPVAPLKPNEVAALAKWVEMGLPWPENSAVIRAEDAWRTHWAFQPVVQPPLPVASDLSLASWPKTPVDLFILEKLNVAGLLPSPAADRRTLLRRASFDLTGLPPTFEDITAFEQDESPDAFERQIDRLLASPRYGERWARHWLDVARYADNKGYVFFEEKNYPWSYTYRDYVVRSLNEDKPYDRFVLEQLAADQLDLGSDQRPLTALGFLTIGAHFMGNVHDIADDRIDVITRGLMGLTVSCARCHDHKYDPIPQADYYALYGVLRSSSEPLVPPEFAPPPGEEQYEYFATELAVRNARLEKFVRGKHAALVEGARTRVGEYLLAAQAERAKPSTEDFMLLTDPGELNPAMIVRYRIYLEKTEAKPHPVWLPWHLLAAIPEAQFSEQSPAAIAAMAKGEMAAGEKLPVEVHPLVLKELTDKPPQSLADVAARYGKLFKRIDEGWLATVKSCSEQKLPAPTSLAAAAEEQLRQELYGEEVPANLPLTFGWGFLSLLPDRASQGEYQKLLKDVEQWLMNGPAAPPRAMVLRDGERYDPRIFLRGNPHRLGDPVTRQFVAVASKDRKPFSSGSGRLEMARAVVSRDNPLTARVFVNRLWLHHFGAGLVRTPSDFGLRSEPPSHPELLDYLASRFMQEGCSVKRMQRWMVGSAAYGQSSEVSGYEGVRVRGIKLGTETRTPSHPRTHTPRADPENRILSRFPRRRLDFESMRDAILCVAGELDSTVGGPPVNLLDSGFHRRRSLYAFLDRQDLPGLLSTFDFPSPNASSPQRDTTTVPPQALYWMNGPFVAQATTRLLTRPEIGAATYPQVKVARLYESILARKPTDDENQLAAKFLGASPTAELWHQLAQALLMTNEFIFVD